jgi:chromosome segregation ATPase
MAKEGLSNSQVELHSLVAEADRLRTQKRASEGELLALYNRLVAQEKQAAALVRSVSEAEAALASERFLRNAISEELSKAEQLTTAKDAEVELLRNQLTLSEATADAMQTAAEHNAKLANASADKAAASSGRSSTLTRMLIAAIIFSVVSFSLNIVQLRGKLPI